MSAVSGIREDYIPSFEAEQHCRRFSLAEIKLATEDFSDECIIGKGGFGRVYKGLIDKGQKTVAIKRLESYSRQGEKEFLAEIEILAKLRHDYLVSLFGYCNESGEMILVYEYVANGTLADHLFPSGNSHDCSSLTWMQCLNICIQTGRALEYLHTGRRTIHRDVKSTNILLDENFVAKVSDFGLAKYLSRGPLQTHVTTQVKGTPGYLDPNYLETGKLTRECDIYAFGVVLLEVLSGRRATDKKLAYAEGGLIK